MKYIYVIGTICTQAVCFGFRREPAYTFGNPERLLKPSDFPGPGGHDPKFEYVNKARPAFSFGFPFRNPATFQNPAPNTYCEKKVRIIILYTKLSCEIQVVLYNMYTCTMHTTSILYFQFKLWKKTIPASSFGIRHSTYLGKREAYLKPSNLNVLSSQ